MSILNAIRALNVKKFQSSETAEEKKDYKVLSQN